jgi:eukaryotic-like serine/threonine-protein kinase
MGKIYLVRDPSDGSYWAAKQFKGDLTRPLLVQRFRREFRALQALDHPAIVKVKNLEYTQKQMFFLMEYVNGISMDQMLSQTSVRDSEWIKKVLQWIRYLCEPLHYIHRQHMVHRDLKPGNIMILDSDAAIPVKLLDFGVIHWTHADSIATGKLTFFGSLRYMAPEQINNETPDLRSDLYSLGVILYEALTGRPPFSIDNPLLLMNLHQMSDPPPPRRLNPNISENLQNMVLSLLFKRPDDRPGSALDIANWIDQILAGDQFVSPITISSNQTAGNIFHPEFVGRDTEIKALIKAWHQTTKSHTRICLVYGAAGIGKSRLIRRLMGMPDLASQHVCMGEYFADRPFLSGFTQALKSGLNSLDKRKRLSPVHSNNAISFDALENQFKSAIESLNIKPDSKTEKKGLRAKAAGILTLLGSIARDRPLILVLDDIHLAGSSDLDVLKHIIELHEMNKKETEQRGLFVVLGYRIEADNLSESFLEFLDWLVESSYRVDLPLKGLSKTDVTKMIRSMLGGSSTQSFSESVFGNSDGNPLLVIETVKDILEHQPGLLWQDIEQDDDTLAIPYDEKLVQIVVKRLDQLSGETRKVLMASAVLGVVFRADELELLCEMPDDLFLDQVDLLIRNRILEEDLSHRDSYRFTHAKLQEAVLEKMSKPVEVDFHRKCISVLEQLHADNLEPVAMRLLHHSITCEWHEKIMVYRYLAAQIADRSGAMPEALEHLEHAMALIPSIQTVDETLKTERIKIQLMWAKMLRMSGSLEQCENILKTTLSELVSTDQTGLTAQAYLQLGVLFGAQGIINKALEYLNASLALYNKLNDPIKIIDCYMNIGVSYNSVGDFENYTKYSALAMEKARAIGDDERMVVAMINLGTAYIVSKREQEGLPYLYRAIEILDALKFVRMKAYALLSIASSYMMDDNPRLDQETAEKVIDLTEQVLTIAHTTGELTLLSDGLYKRAVAKHSLGFEVIEDLNKALAISNRIGHNWFSTNIIQFRDNVLLQKGDQSHA